MHNLVQYRIDSNRYRTLFFQVTLTDIAMSIVEQDAGQFVRAARIEFPREIVALHAGIPRQQQRLVRVDEVGMTSDWVAAPVQVRIAL